MTATIHHITPRRVHNAFRAPASHTTHGTRDPARPASSVGRAVDFDRHRQTCETCRCTPCVCDVRGFDAVAYRTAMQTLPRHADLRARINHGRGIDLSAVALIACTVGIVALSMTCLFAAEWLHGLIYG